VTSGVGAGQLRRALPTLAGTDPVNDCHPGGLYGSGGWERIDPIARRAREPVSQRPEGMWNGLRREDTANGPP